MNGDRADSWISTGSSFQGNGGALSFRVGRSDLGIGGSIQVSAGNSSTCAGGHLSFVVGHSNSESGAGGGVSIRGGSGKTSEVGLEYWVETRMRNVAQL